jgi:hypothetical protein
VPGSHSGSTGACLPRAAGCVHNRELTSARLQVVAEALHSITRHEGWNSRRQQITLQELRTGTSEYGAQLLLYKGLLSELSRPGGLGEDAQAAVLRAAAGEAATLSLALAPPALAHSITSAVRPLCCTQRCHAGLRRLRQSQEPCAGACDAGRCLPAWRAGH